MDPEIIKKREKTGKGFLIILERIWGIGMIAIGRPNTFSGRRKI
jgi:hypothetical protein